MSVNVRSPTGGNKFRDDSRTPVWGIRTPVEVKAMVKNLKDVKKPVFRKLLKAAVGYIESSDFSEDFFANLSKEASLPYDSLTSIFSGLLAILKAAFRVPLSSLKQEAFKSDLVGIRLPEDFIEDLVSAVYEAKRSSIEESLSKPSTKLPGLHKFRWRVDVAISNSALSRVLEPTVFMELTLSNGTVKQITVPISKFHELRYNVSSVLKEMEELERRSILKIQD